MPACAQVKKKSIAILELAKPTVSGDTILYWLHTVAVAEEMSLAPKGELLKVIEGIGGT